MDFVSQVLTGEDVGNAAIKTTELAVAVVAGCAAGVRLSVAFDCAYEKGLKEGIGKVVNVVTGFLVK